MADETEDLEGPGFGESPSGDEVAASESEAVQQQEYFGTHTKNQTPVERRSFGHLWLVSYSDFMTIMMIFFLVLYGYTVLGKAALLKERRNHITYSEFAKIIGEIKGPLGESLQVQEDIGKVVLEMPEEILFTSGQAALNQNAKRTLEEVANSLKLIDGDVVVEGHTDDVPVRAGRFQSNWELSTARSFSVIEELAERGVAQKRLAAWGFGEHRPLVSNRTAAGRAKNRRIELVLLKKSGPYNK